MIEEIDIVSPVSDPSKKRLSPVQWLEIVSLAKSGTSVTAIAEQYDVQRSSIYRGLEVRGVKVGELQAAAKREQEEIDRKKLVEKIRKTKEDGLKRVEIIEGLTMKYIVDAHNSDGKNIRDVEDDIKTLDKAMSIIVKGNSAKWRILGLDKENENTGEILPEIVVREITEFEVAEIRRRQRTENSDLSAEELELIAETEIKAALADEEGDDEIVEEG